MPPTFKPQLYIANPLKILLFTTNCLKMPPEGTERHGSELKKLYTNLITENQIRYTGCLTRFTISLGRQSVNVESSFRFVVAAAGGVVIIVAY